MSTPTYVYPVRFIVGDDSGNARGNQLKIVGGTWSTSGDLVTLTLPGGGGGAPTTADYLVKTANGSLSAERVVTDTTSITVDWSTAGQAKFQREALTGDVTAAQNSNATTIAANAVTLAKMATVATQTFLGRTTAGTGNVEALTATQATAMLDTGTSSLKGALKLGAPGGAQEYSAGLTSLAALYAGTLPNNECWLIGQSRTGVACWTPRPRTAYAGWKAQVSYGASDTWTIIGSDTSGATAFTQTTVAAASTNATNGLRVTTLTSAASSGSVVGFRSSSTLGSRVAHSVAIITGEMPGTLTSSRVWLGWMSEGTLAAMGAGDAPASLSYIGVLRSTGLANTNLWIVEANATNVLSTDTGIATASIPASTEYSVAFSWDAAKTSVQVWLSIAGGAWALLGTASTYPPAASTGLAIGACTTALSASARTCSLHAVEALRD